MRGAATLLLLIPAACEGERVDDEGRVDEWPAPEGTRDDVDCTEQGLAGDGDEEFVSAFFVVDGTLGDVCFGSQEPTLRAAWDLLAAITPPDQLAPLAIFSGFEAPESDVLAYVDAVGQFDGRVFQMALNLSYSDPDDPELALTLAHEFSHVVTGRRDQLDRLTDPASCDTYDNGEGCAEPDSYLYAWVDEFWPADLLAGLDVTVDDPNAAAQRCSVDPGFLGEYAATNPEEDFAESFAAYVFGVDVAGDEVERKVAFFEQYPELAGFRERADAIGMSDLDYEFDRCG